MSCVCRTALMAVRFCLAAAVAVSILPAASKIPQAGWARHTIDQSSQGADGVRLSDVNGDGLLDIATGWEEGGRIRVYLNPGATEAKHPWPAVTVGEVTSPEDAVFADLDGDGAFDVISSCEGETQTMYVHWAPKQPDRYLDPTAWKTEAIPASVGERQWMFAVALEIDGRHGVDLVAGSKGSGAQIGWFESPQVPRDLSKWKWHPLYDAGWIMSLVAHDIDGDGDDDIVASDRYSATSGCLWLENPGQKHAADGRWKEHRIGAVNKHHMMFLKIVDLDEDGMEDVIVADKSSGGRVIYHRRVAERPPRWESHAIPFPPKAASAKGIAAADIDFDGKKDIVLTFSSAKDDLASAVWLSYRDSPMDPVWDVHDIGGLEGIKFDRIELLDLDADADLDIITCEERDQLGVIWYENPVR